MSISENWTEQDDYRTDGWGELSKLEFLIALVTALVGIFTTGGIPGQTFFARSCPQITPIPQMPKKIRRCEVSTTTR
jgi:hypothetical protein